MTRTLLTATVFALVAVPGRADDYYLAVFSAETVPYRPRHTHTFVGAVRVPTPVNGVITPVEVTSISWVPASLRARGLTLRPEPGVNLGIPETLAWVGGRGMRVSVWGPYQVHPDLYYTLQAQAARLSAGVIQYKPTDNLFSPSRAANCYHAVTDPVSTGHRYSGPFTAGDAAGGSTVAAYAPWVVDPQMVYPDLLPVMGAGGRPVLPRAFDDRPTRRAAIRSFLRR